MKETLIATALNWQLQKADFAHDGTLRDIYVQNATIHDWMVVVGIIQRGAYGAQLQRGGVEVAVPASFESLFTSEKRYGMSFTIAGVAMECHFFTPEEIEFSFGPEEVTDQSLQGLLAFMIELGDQTVLASTPDEGQRVVSRRAG